jgi:aurora kinase, other
LLLNFSCILNPYKNEELSIGMFEVGRKLGRGKFGDVYMCRDTNSGFACAIKMISKAEVRTAGMEAQLMQEIKIQLYSNHPNVLKMYGFFHDPNKVYLLLELVTSGCLFKEIRKKNHFEENLSSFYFRQVVSGVRYLHSNYIIHRDIKPENILNNFNVLKICDFGWAIYSPL